MADNIKRGTVQVPMVNSPIPILLHVNDKSRFLNEFAGSMNKFNSPSSNNSGTSSEASETHSVEEAPSTAAQSAASQQSVSRLPKTWKRLKEGGADKDAEAKRPPWRAVSVSTLPKPDKSALLRAKLLDASRRLRASKNSVALQTDMEPTKLMKEACIGAQTDLILYKEVGMLTDGSYTKKKESYDKFILTYSVSQMTDSVASADACTQTLLPKVAGDDFLDAYHNATTAAAGDNRSDADQFNELERKLLQQISKIRQTANMSSDSEAPAINDNNTNSTTSDNNNNNNNDMPHMQTIGNALKRPSLLQPTLESWHFEYDGLEAHPNGIDENFMPYILAPSRPWGKLAPLPLTMALRAGQLSTRQSMDWSLMLIAIDQLIQESNRLVDLIEDITARHNAKKYNSTNEHKRPTSSSGRSSSNINDCGTSLVASFQPQVQTYPADYWLNVVEQQEQQLSEMLNN